jgi:hypothetical protein
MTSYSRTLFPPAAAAWVSYNANAVAIYASATTTVKLSASAARTARTAKTTKIITTIVEGREQPMRVTGMMIARGYLLPWWSGVAYYQPDSDYAVVYPIPFNLFVRWARCLWWFLKRGKEDDLSAAYNAGRKVGFREGLNTVSKRENDAIDALLEMHNRSLSSKGKS